MKLPKRNRRRDARRQLENAFVWPPGAEEHGHQVRVGQDARTGIEQPLPRPLAIRHVVDRGSFRSPHPSVPPGAGPRCVMREVTGCYGGTGPGASTILVELQVLPE